LFEIIVTTYGFGKGNFEIIKCSLREH
jgi:hypothetical protein